MDITIKARLKELIRPLSELEFSQLEANIIRDGCREPLALWKHDGQNVLLDGHNRYKICSKEGIKFQTVFVANVTIGKETLPLDSLERAQMWVGQNQNGRRNLDASDRASLGAQLVPAFAEDANRKHKETLAENAKKAEKDITGKFTAVGQKNPSAAYVQTAQKNEDNKATSQAAALVGASPSYVKVATKAAGYDNKTRTFKKPEVLSTIGSGKDQTKIKDVMKDQRQEKHNTALTIARKAAEKVEKAWIVTDKQDTLSCAAVITDPPYGILDESWEPRKLQSFTREWLSRWNKSGADVILSFWSQEHLWTGKSWFDEELSKYEFRQLLVWRFKNNNKPQSRDFFKRSWEPIFFYVLKGAKCHPSPGGTEWGDDTHNFDSHEAAVPQSNFNNADLKQHAAQKPVSVMRWLVSAVTKPGELVVDPFNGSGTTGIAALQLGRRYHGIEIDEKFRKLTEGRIALYGKSK